VRQGAAGVAGDESLYEILQVSPRASHEVIQAAYRVLARTHHPDLSSAADAEERTRRLNAAHFILSDPGRRALYDADRREAARFTAARPASTEPTRPPRSATGQISRGEDRPTSSPLIVWIAAGAVAVTIVVAVLIMLWSLYDVLDDDVYPATSSSSISRPPTFRTPLIDPTRGGQP
jgi:hypothetical protein